jgi:outer membrane biosynthesis protein TonB
VPPADAIHPLRVDWTDPPRGDPLFAAAPVSTPPVADRRALPFGVLTSLAIHLSPLLLLIGWNVAPPQIDTPIPIQLVIEQPPPEPKPEANIGKPPPPAGRLASIDMGQPVDEPQPPASAPEQPAEEPAEQQVAAAPPPPKPPPPDLVSALPKPTVPSEPLAAPLPEPEPPKPAIKRVVAAAAPPRPHPAPPPQVPGPAATRDEYLAYISALINRRRNLLAPSLIGGRRGVTVISILVLGDGTIARIAVKRGSGYPEIDARIEQMVAAVGRFPPLPQWIQGPSVQLDYHRVFPDLTAEH